MAINNKILIVCLFLSLDWKRSTVNKVKSSKCYKRYSYMKATKQNPYLWKSSNQTQKILFFWLFVLHFQGILQRYWKKVFSLKILLFSIRREKNTKKILEKEFSVFNSLEKIFKIFS